MSQVCCAANNTQISLTEIDGATDSRGVAGAATTTCAERRAGSSWHGGWWTYRVSSVPALCDSSVVQVSTPLGGWITRQVEHVIRAHKLLTDGHRKNVKILYTGSSRQSVHPLSTFRVLQACVVLCSLGIISWCDWLLLCLNRFNDRFSKYKKPCYMPSSSSYLKRDLIAGNKPGSSEYCFSRPSAETQNLLNRCLPVDWNPARNKFRHTLKDNKASPDWM